MTLMLQSAVAPGTRVSRKFLHLCEHAAILRSKDCSRFLMDTYEPAAFAARVLMCLIAEVCVIRLVLGFAARRRLIKRHDLCKGD